MVLCGPAKCDNLLQWQQEVGHGQILTWQLWKEAGPRVCAFTRLLGALVHGTSESSCCVNQKLGQV